MEKTCAQESALKMLELTAGKVVTMYDTPLGLDFILFAQTLSVLKSLSLDITPDNPCPTGEVNRVVQGVTLYPYAK